MATPRTVAFHTLGCKLNYAETSTVSRLFEKNGYAIVPFDYAADLFVLNTCSVTDNADRECRKYVRQIHRQNPQARIVIMGCYAQLKPKEIASIPGVDLVLGASEKFQVLDYLETLEHAPLQTPSFGGLGGPQRSSIFTNEIQQANKFHPAYSLGDRTRSFLKVQDGCDYKCTFCTIPKARGQSRSATVQEIVDMAKEIGRSGVQEIVLTGVNIGDFGNGTAVIEGAHPKKEALLIDLIRSLDKITEVNRFRISSIEPNLCTEEIISFVASSRRFMPHFHMPLQSGHNDILKGMRRRYRRELYAERVESIRKWMPHACIGVDVISGFPGETDSHFEETYSFLETLEIDYIHAFTYSERKDTPAALMPGVVPISIRRERSQQLRELSQRKKEAHFNRHLGQTRNVLFEKGPDTHHVSGYTDNYIRVLLPFNQELLNTIQPVLLHQLTKFNNETFINASLLSVGLPTAQSLQVLGMAIP